MFPKTWKVLILVPLAASLLTACGEKKKASTNSSSRFSGYWLREEAKADYDLSRQDPAHADEILCRAVLQNRAVHGCPTTGHSWDGRMTVPAFFVTEAGEVFNWAPGLNTRDVEVRRDQYFGRLRDDGSFSKDNAFANGPAQNAAWRGQNSLEEKAYVDYQPGQMLWNRQGRLDRVYSSISKADLERYTRGVQDCLRQNFQRVDPRPVSGTYTEQVPLDQDYAPDNGYYSDRYSQRNGPRYDPRGSNWDQPPVQVQPSGPHPRGGS